LRAKFVAYVLFPMPAQVPFNGADHPSDDTQDQGSIRKRVFDVLSESLSQTGRKKKHKKYVCLLVSFNLVATLRTLIGMMYFCHTFAQDARFRGLLALFSILPACSG